MFSTYFYILVLIFQLFISDNAGSYNQNVSNINLMIENKDYKKAYSEINKIDRYTVFNNHEINNLKILLSIKVNLGIKELLKDKELDNYQLPIILSKMGKNKEALVFLRKNIIKANNDSLIKLYEIYSQKNIKRQIKGSFNVKTIKIDNSMSNADALALLDLMKKKEKYLSYKSNVK